MCHRREPAKTEDKQEMLSKHIHAGYELIGGKKQSF